MRPRAVVAALLLPPAMTVIDLFAGPGGWDLGARTVGLDPVGIELDEDACQTRHAAGLRTIQADASRLPIPARLEVDGLIASPPCPDFSTAGKGAGITGETGRLMWTVPRFVEQYRPRWVACENVPPALPWWAQFAEAFRGLGYRTWCGVLNAADFGVPQTRKRAFLLASLDREPHPPLASHSRCPTDGMFGTERPWVSMAQALDWPDDYKAGFPRRDDLGTSPDGYRERDWRQATEPAFAMTEKGRSWMVNTGRDWKPGGTRADAQRIPASRPSPALTAITGGQWTIERPATTIAGDSRCFPPGGHKANDGRDNSRMVGRSEGAIKLSEPEGLILQGFPPDYPIRGRTKTSRWRQIGNAVCPPVAARILEQFT